MAKNILNLMRFLYSNIKLAPSLRLTNIWGGGGTFIVTSQLFILVLSVNPREFVIKQTLFNYLICLLNDKEDNKGLTLSIPVKG